MQTVEKPDIVSENKHKAASLSFDLSKQFLSIAFAGIAFAIGVSAADGQVFSMWLFWVAVGFFGVSVVLGFLFMMRGAADYSDDKIFDIYELGARLMAFFQIVFVLVGVVFLLFLHRETREGDGAGAEGVKVQFGDKVISAPVGTPLDLKLNADGSLELKSEPK